MKTFRIIIDDDDRGQEPGQPWTANLYAEGESEDSRGVAFGATPQEAVYNLAVSRHAVDWQV